MRTLPNIIAFGNESGGGGETGAGVQIDLLWTNPTLEGPFASQTVTVNMNYDFHIIVYSGYISDYNVANRLTQSVVLDKGATSCNLINIESLDLGTPILSRRTTSRQTSGIYFNQNYISKIQSGGSVTSDVDNLGCMPYKIYGVKVTQPNIPGTTGS